MSEITSTSLLQSKGIDEKKSKNMFLLEKVLNIIADMLTKYFTEFKRR